MIKKIVNKITNKDKIKELEQIKKNNNALKLKIKLLVIRDLLVSHYNKF